jgi:hypothetical protein
VDQAPARVDVHQVEQAFDRPPAMQNQALLDLKALLGDVDVQRPAGPERIGQQFAQGVGGDRAQ